MARTTDLLDEAQAIEAGYAALAFLAEDLARLTRFLDLTGLSPDQLRSQAGDPAMLAAVVEHLLGDESLLLTFTANAGLPPEAAAQLPAMLRRIPAQPPSMSHEGS